MKDKHRVDAPEKITIESLQRSVVSMFNIVLGGSPVESHTFWKEQLLPEAQMRFNMEANDLSSSACSVPASSSGSTSSCIGLFRSLEYHFRVKFRSSVIQQNAMCLPLQQHDLSTFEEPVEALLFPHLFAIRAATVGLTAKASTGRPAADQTGVPQERNHSGGNLEANLQSTIQNATSVEVARASCRGFFPSAAAVFPKSLRILGVCRQQLEDTRRPLYGDAEDDRTTGPSLTSPLFPLLRLSSMTSGACAPLRAALLGFAHPCHPACPPAPVDEVDNASLMGGFSLTTDTKAGEHAAAFTKKERLQRQLHRHKNKQTAHGTSTHTCKNFALAKLGLNAAFAALTHAGCSVVVLGKTLLALTYLSLQHNDVKGAYLGARCVLSAFPGLLVLQSDATVILVECLLRERRYEDAVALYGRLLPTIETEDGPRSLRLLQLDLALAAAAHHRHADKETVANASKALKLSILMLESTASHWTGLVALRLLGSSLLRLHRYAEAAGAFELAVRAAAGAMSDTVKFEGGLRQASRGLPPYVENLNRYWLAVALERKGNLREACTMAQMAFRSLEETVGATHAATLSSLYLAGKTQSLIGSKKLLNPPLALTKRDYKEAEKTGMDVHVYRRTVRSQDLVLVDSLLRDPEARKSREAALEFFTRLFRRLIHGQKSCLVLGDMSRPHGMVMEDENQYKGNLFAVTKEILQVKILSLKRDVIWDFSNLLVAMCISRRRAVSIRALAKENLPPGSEGGQQTCKPRGTATGPLHSQVAMPPDVLPSREHDKMTLEFLLYSASTRSIEEICDQCLADCSSRKWNSPPGMLLAGSAGLLEEEPGAATGEPWPTEHSTQGLTQTVSYTPCDWFHELIYRLMQSGHRTVRDLLLLLDICRLLLPSLLKQFIICTAANALHTPSQDRQSTVLTAVTDEANTEARAFKLLTGLPVGVWADEFRALAFQPIVAPNQDVTQWTATTLHRFAESMSATPRSRCSEVSSAAKSKNKNF
eukprot:GHVT01084296.1.p1 GENE.GHVT01084296.1~~GHVT01084296.1.p1  ORF type:complete len:995 (-),score=125.81 GHVT01084296.1:423-3407(-)